MMIPHVRARVRGDSSGAYRSRLERETYKLRRNAESFRRTAAVLIRVYSLRSLARSFILPSSFLARLNERASERAFSISDMREKGARESQGRPLMAQLF